MYEQVIPHIGLILLGFVTGAYGTLIGAGGGFILMPSLLLLYPNVGQENLTAMSLAVVFFNALSGSEAYAEMGRIDYKSGLMFAAATVPGAIFGALHTSFISRSLFDAVFGVVLILLSIALVLHPGIAHETKPERRDGGSSWWKVTRSVVDKAGNRYSYSFNPVIGIALSFFVGYTSSFLGIGGGIIHVPALTYVLDFPVHVATATSHFILVIMALTGTMVHIVTGTFSYGVHKTIYIAIGVVIGARLGAYLSKRIRGAWIIRSLAIALGLLGVRILMSVVYK